MNTNEHSEREWKVLPLSAEILHLDDELLRAVLVAIRANVRAALATKQPSVEDCIKQLVIALVSSKGWQHAYADAIIRDAIDRKHLEQNCAVPAGYALVPLEILDRFPEINPSNYDHDDACALNAWGVELVLSAEPQPPAEQAPAAHMAKVGEPVALIQNDDLNELMHCNGMTLWAENPRIYAPEDSEGVPAPVGYVPVFRAPPDTLAVLKQLLEVVEDLQEWDTATQGDIVVYSPEVIDAAHAHIDAVEKRHG